MKVTTIALGIAFTLTSTLALAQTTGTEGYGSVVAPSVGSYSCVCRKLDSAILMVKAAKDRS
jgi:hypothetical protein